MAKSRVDAITDAWFNSPYHKTYSVKDDEDYVSNSDYWERYILKRVKSQLDKNNSNIDIR